MGLGTLPGDSEGLSHLDNSREPLPKAILQAVQPGRDLGSEPQTRAPTLHSGPGLGGSPDPTCKARPTLPQASGDFKRLAEDTTTLVSTDQLGPASRGHPQLDPWE